MPPETPFFLLPILIENLRQMMRFRDPGGDLIVIFPSTCTDNTLKFVLIDT